MSVLYLFGAKTKTSIFVYILFTVFTIFYSFDRLKES